ncbi:39S ribosomal protein L12, mitochondrial [Astyanax mexicanus]|uniref:Large ribosomal subunit protein bL12m n=1 Tax=Astyanax mexicanus TaxID=7994 RepID=A0A3B1KL10_ASTMX|nr:39S ribosomal protein L12, mitochondrial [Astyanax mexicanus]
MYCTLHCIRTSLRVAAQAHGHHLPAPALCALRTLRTSPASRNDAIATPPLDGAPKQYSPKIQQLVNDISSLSLLEVSDLNELLKKTLNIQDVGMMSMGAMAAAPSAAVAAPAADEEPAPAKKEKTHFTVKLTELKAADKVKLIKEVKNCIQGLNLVQAKKLVESLPQEIRANVSKEEAEKLKTALEAAGGTVVLE